LPRAAPPAASRRAVAAPIPLLDPVTTATVFSSGPPLTTTESLAVVSPVAPAAAFEELNEDDARSRARDGAEHARRAGFEAEARADLGAPTWEGIVDVADEIDAALIVTGSRGLRRVSEPFKGSVSHDLAEHAGRPVLIVPPAKAAP
jgi:nucleotide-binding universal stress UspA family protein